MSTLTLKKIFFTGTFLSYILSVPCMASAPLFPYEEIPEDVKTGLKQAAKEDGVMCDVMVRLHAATPPVKHSPLTAEYSPLILQEGLSVRQRLLRLMFVQQELCVALQKTNPDDRPLSPTAHQKSIMSKLIMRELILEIYKECYQQSQGLWTRLISGESEDVLAELVNMAITQIPSATSDGISASEASYFQALWEKIDSEASKDGPDELTKMVGSMALTQERPPVTATSAAADPSAEGDIYL